MVELYFPTYFVLGLCHFQIKAWIVSVRLYIFFLPDLEITKVWDWFIVKLIKKNKQKTLIFRAPICIGLNQASIFNSVYVILYYISFLKASKSVWGSDPINPTSVLEACDTEPASA